MIMIDGAEDVGVAQMQDFVFTVADILPGAILIEVNMAGAKPSDVGLWFCNFRIAAAKRSKVEANCKDAKTFVVAHTTGHFTTSSSSHWEHTWDWTADVDVDGSSSEVASPMAGFLIEDQKSTWMLGMGSDMFILSSIFVIHQKVSKLHFRLSLIDRIENTVYSTRSRSTTRRVCALVSWKLKPHIGKGVTQQFSLRTHGWTV
jgi:glucan 1,3-beta-glucosidase